MRAPPWTSWALLVGSGLLTVAACADRAAQVTPGMRESEVRTLLGTATRSTTDRSDIEFYVGRHTPCARAAVKVLVFERWLRLDVMIGVSADGKVACVKEAMLLTH
jgi:hypothetical protein